MTAAHKELPIPTYAEVVNLENGRRVVVKINDRGPFHENRIIDLSYAAASRIGMSIICSATHCAYLVCGKARVWPVSKIEMVESVPPEA